MQKPTIMMIKGESSFLAVTSIQFGPGFSTISELKKTPKLSETESSFPELVYVQDNPKKRSCFLGMRLSYTIVVEAIWNPLAQGTWGIDPHSSGFGSSLRSDIRKRLPILFFRPRPKFSDGLLNCFYSQPAFLITRFALKT